MLVETYYSQVRRVQKIPFVGNFWGFVKLYIFGILGAWRIQKPMFAFAQTPGKQSFWTFKMADIKYIIYAILALTQPRNSI